MVGRTPTKQASLPSSPGPWPLGPSIHLWACSPSSVPASRAWSPSSCASAGTTLRSCPAWQKAFGSASRSASTSSAVAGGTAPPSTTAWPSSAPCWTKVRLPGRGQPMGAAGPSHGPSSALVSYLSTGVGVEAPVCG